MIRLRRRRLPRQLELTYRPGWGGSRAGSGRKRAPHRIGLQRHLARPDLDPRDPVLVTIRALSGLPSFRKELPARMIVAEIRRASAKGFRILHFSIQTNHLHLIVEAEDDVALSRGMQRLNSRVARQMNVLAGRRGPFWRDRYHRSDLTTPTQFRNALVYVVFNRRKHTEGTERERQRRVLDPLSSAFWIENWAPYKSPYGDLLDRIRRARVGPCPVAAAVTFTARHAWLRLGALRPDECPRLRKSKPPPRTICSL